MLFACAGFCGHVCSYVANQMKFQGRSETAMAFTAKEAERQAAVKRKDNLHIGGGRFVGDTTAHQDFTGKHGPRTQPIKPKEHRMPDRPFDGTTTNQETYKEVHVSSRG